MSKLWLQALLLVVMTSVSLAENRESELTGTYRKGQGMGTPFLEIDGPSRVKRIDVQGACLKEIPDGTRLWIRGQIQSYLQGGPGAPRERQPQQPTQWVVVMEADECRRIIEMFETPPAGDRKRTASDALIPAGRLGHALGTYLTIEGIRLEKGKVGTRSLQVDTVNGRRLPEPMGIWIENVKDPGLPRGTRCVIKGYESGRMIGIPPEVAEAEHVEPHQACWQLQRYFIMTSVVEPASLEKE
jgi:hypothetical protein